MYQLWLLILLLIYCTFRELVSGLGPQRSSSCSFTIGPDQDTGQEANPP